MRQIGRRGRERRGRDTGFRVVARWLDDGKEHRKEEGLEEFEATEAAVRDAANRAGAELDEAQVLRRAANAALGGNVVWCARARADEPGSESAPCAAQTRERWEQAWAERVRSNRPDGLA